ncbi:MAG: class I SAM-dependent methyltransferase [Acidimicrobiales bacterium]
MVIDNATGWDRWSSTYQAGMALPADVVHYGPDLPGEDELRLCGDVRGKRVLDLGCGGGQSSLAFARQGGISIGVDFSAEQLAYARRLSDQEGIKVELHQSDLAELAFIRADTIDLAFSAYAFDWVEDLARVFRQVHRVLKPGAALVFSLTHPAFRMVEPEPDPGSDEPLAVKRSYFDTSPRVRTPMEGLELVEYPHTMNELFTSLSRANFRVDTMLEPAPTPAGPRSALWREAFLSVPRTLIMRARKEGT